MNTRLSATQILMQVIKYKKSLNAALVSLSPENEQSAFVKEICYGVTRWYFQLKFILDKLLEKPLREKDKDLELLLLIGLYQANHMRIPDYALVNETVDAVKKLKKNWGVNLVNAVLRNFLREKEALQKAVESNNEAKFAHPNWMIRKTQTAWPNHWERILHENNQHPPMSLRVNQQKISREDYLKRLAAKNIKAFPSTISPCGVILNDPVHVNHIPEFEKGFVSIQDIGAQLAASLLDLKPGLCVLDACAAPGGKLTHILETEPNLKTIVAVEKDLNRTQKIKENLKRCGYEVNVIVGDVSQPSTWWNGKHFDRILLDAPCSSSGVIRRHPDIKLLKRQTDIQNHAHCQRALLDATWKLLKPDGKLLYSTCSIFPEENIQNIEAFLKGHRDAKIIPFDLSWGRPQKFGQQILPGDDDMDGFYYVLLLKCELRFSTT